MPISTLTSAPPALDRDSLAEISTATPSSFEGIAPLLRYKSDEAHVTLDPPFEGFAAGDGQVFVTEEALSFFSPSTSTGITIPYPHISLHAISRAPFKTAEQTGADGATTNGDSTSTSSGGGPCIYCQVDEVVVDESADEIEGQTRELIIVPKDASTLDKMFDMLSYCASLHPPPSSDDPNALFGGLDPDSMVYADANGNIVGPGLEHAARGPEAWQDAIEDDEGQDGGNDGAAASVEPSAGRVRSDFVADTRPKPY